MLDIKVSPALSLQHQNLALRASRLVKTTIGETYHGDMMDVIGW